MYLWGMGEYLGGAGEAITTLADGDVEHELLNFDLPHRVRLLLLRRLQSQTPKPKPTHTVRTAQTRESNDSLRKENGMALSAAHLPAASSPWGDWGGDGERGERVFCSAVRGGGGGKRKLCKETRKP
jgi:hypothetical protein